MNELSQSAYFHEYNGSWFFIIEEEGMPIPDERFTFELDQEIIR